MELATVLDLVKAGFTKDEIMQLQNPAAPTPAPAPEPALAQEPATEPVQLSLDIPAPSAQPAPAPVVEPVAVAVPAPAPAPVPVPVPAAAPAPVPAAAPVPQNSPVTAPDQPTMADLMQGIAKLTSAVQANAIAHSVIPGGLQNPPSAEDMLAEIIRPTYKGGEK